MHDIVCDEATTIVSLRWFGETAMRFAGMRGGAGKFGGADVEPEPPNSDSVSKLCLR